MKRIKGAEVIILSRSTYSGISIKMERENPKSIKSNTLDKISYEFFLFHQLQFHSHSVSASSSQTLYPSMCWGRVVIEEARLSGEKLTIYQSSPSGQS